MQPRRAGCWETVFDTDAVRPPRIGPEVPEDTGYRY